MAVWRLISPRSLKLNVESVTQKVQIGSWEAYITIEGSHLKPTGVHIVTGKFGSHIRQYLAAWCALFNLRMQESRVPWYEQCKAGLGLKSEPFGPTSDPNIPWAHSAIDYAMKLMLLRGGRMTLEQLSEDDGRIRQQA